MADPTMKKPLIVSVVFHLTVLIAAAVGMPHIKTKSDEMLVNTPMMIEVVEFDEITQTDKPAPAAPKKVKKPAPPKMTEEQAPDLSIPAPAPVKEEKQTEQAELVPPPKAPPKKPPPKPKVKKPEVTKKAAPPQKDFASLLKNLTPDADEKRQPEAPAEPVETEPQEQPVMRLGERLTVNELDALRAQLASCWLVLGGARNAEDLIVEVRVSINPDRTVRQASVIDQGRYNRDTHFRAAADAAIRALHNPRCSPLKLPEDKYESWKSTIIRFDPSQML